MKLTKVRVRNRSSVSAGNVSRMAGSWIVEATLSSATMARGVARADPMAMPMGPVKTLARMAALVMIVE